eukprot:615110-Rhodomonas_salina.1
MLDRICLIVAVRLRWANHKVACSRRGDAAEDDGASVAEVVVNLYEANSKRMLLAPEGALTMHV